MKAFEDTIAMVTGGASGIGAACAKCLLDSGATVVIADRCMDAAEALARQLGARAIALEVDVADEAGCRRMVDATVERYGRLDVAVNCAGLGNTDRSRVADLSYESWRRLMAVNLDGVFLCMKAEIAAMVTSGSGSIVNVSSIMGLVAVDCASAYVASKHGVVGLTRAAALDYAQSGIRINAVCPGYVATPMLANRTPEQQAEIASRHPQQRIASPAEIATMVTFLASSAAEFITGACYAVDGGYTAR